MTRIATFLSIISAVTILNANANLKCPEEAIPTPDCILDRNKLTENIKSNKGWLRLLNSKEKMERYGIVLSSLEQKILKDYFRNKSDKARRILR